MHGLAAAIAQAEKYELQARGLIVMPKAIAGRGGLSIPRIKALSSKAA